MDFSKLALKLALIGNPAEEIAHEPTLDLSPLEEKLDQIALALGVMSKMPRPVSA